VKDDRLYLTHILDSIERVERYTVEGKRVFLEDEKTQDATVRNLQTMAESTQRLSDSLKARRSEIDWDDIAGFRNIAVHGYLSFDYEKAWNVVENRLPKLKRAAEALMSHLDAEAGSKAGGASGDA
jgi:uncharacterized protein with HEPN domain